MATENISPSEKKKLIRRVRVAIVDEAQTSFRSAPLRKAAQTTLSLHGIDRGRISILLTGNSQIRVLNRDFRQIDAETDVLTFPAPTDWDHSIDKWLGDIAISVEEARRQANARGWSLDDELGHLTIHGCLHLVGFDDEAESDRSAMMAAASCAASELGLPTDVEWSSLPHSSPSRQEAVL